jgi:hypothetical protein
VATTPEGKVKDKIKLLVKKYGGYYYMAPGGMHGVAGTPDLLCCVNGIFIAIEAKVYGNKPTVIQLAQIKKIQAAGGNAIVITERDCAVLEDILKHASQK